MYIHNNMCQNFYHQSVPGAFISRKRFQFLKVKDREQAEMLEKILVIVKLNTKFSA